MKKYKTVREAYDAIHKRNKLIRIQMGDSKDRANRTATKMAVRFAWSEFNIYNEMGDVLDEKNTKTF